MNELPTICLRYEDGRLVHWFEPAGLAPTLLRIGSGAVLSQYVVRSTRHPTRSVRLYMRQGSLFPEGYQRDVDAVLDGIQAGDGAPTAGG